MYYLLLSLWLTQTEVETVVDTKKEHEPVMDTVESTFADLMSRADLEQNKGRK